MYACRGFLLSLACSGYSFLLGVSWTVILASYLWKKSYTQKNRNIHDNNITASSWNRIAFMSICVKLTMLCIEQSIIISPQIVLVETVSKRKQNSI